MTWRNTNLWQHRVEGVSHSRAGSVARGCIYFHLWWRKAVRLTCDTGTGD